MPSKPSTPLQAWKRRFWAKSALLLLELVILWLFLRTFAPKWALSNPIYDLFLALFWLKCAWFGLGVGGFFSTTRKGKTNGKA